MRQVKLFTFHFGRSKLAYLRFLLFVLSAIVASCGGTEPDPYQVAVAKANAKQSEAQALALDTPCSEAAQCATLVFSSPTAVCLTLSYIPYSLAAPTAAAASAAAADQRSIAATAMSLAPDGPRPCTLQLPLPPVPACSSNVCILKSYRF